MGNILLRSEFQINFCGLEDFILTSLSALFFASGRKLNWQKKRKEEENFLNSFEM